MIWVELVARAAREQVACALAGLVEAHWYFQLQGVDGDNRRRHAQQAARALLATLDT